MNEAQTEKDEEIARNLLEMAQHETSEVDRRITWMCAFQGLLFAAFGLVMNVKIGESPTMDFSPNFLIFIFGALGIITSFLVFKSLACKTRARLKINADWKELIKRNCKFAVGLYPDEESGKCLWRAYLSAENLMPLVFIISWFVVLFYVCMKNDNHCWCGFIFILLLMTLLVLSREFCIANTDWKKLHASKNSEAQTE